jgi:hypothetical protein
MLGRMLWINHRASQAVKLNASYSKSHLHLAREWRRGQNHIAKLFVGQQSQRVAWLPFCGLTQYILRLGPANQLDAWRFQLVNCVWDAYGAPYAPDALAPARYAPYAMSRLCEVHAYQHSTAHMRDIAYGALKAAQLQQSPEISVKM